MIEVENLRKLYRTWSARRRVEALGGITFRVGKGEILGFLGPNGAGKTTCMKIITGYMAATSGTVRVDGVDVHEDSLKTRGRIGYLPEDAPIYRDMGVRDYLSYIAQMRAIPGKQRLDRMREVVRVCGLDEVIGKGISELSKGYRQRVGLAQALIHEPDVLVLDEPTAGLDPNQTVEIRALIRKLGQKRTIILSTHNLPEVLQTCDRMVVINRGNVVADGTAAELEQRVSVNPPVFLRLRAEGAEASAVKRRLAEVTGVADVQHRASVAGAHDYELVATVGSDIRPAVSKTVADAGWTLLELRRNTLEEIFRTLTRGN